MKQKHIGIFLIAISFVILLMTVLFFGPRNPQYLVNNPLEIFSYILHALAYALFHVGIFMEIFALLCLVSGVYIFNKSVTTQTPTSLTVGKPFRVIDLVYFFLAIPIILTVLQYITCALVTLISGSGVKSAEICSVGWALFSVMVVVFFAPPWLILALTAAPLRLRALFKINGASSPIFWLYIISTFIPLIILLPLVHFPIPRIGNETSSIPTLVPSENIVTQNDLSEDVVKNQSNESAVSNSLWSTYSNKDFSIQYPSDRGWIFDDTNFVPIGVSFGTPESLYGGFMWSAKAVNKNVVDLETLISRMGSQFSDRIEVRKNIIINGVPALLVTVSTKQASNGWVSNSVFIDGTKINQPERIYIISDGATNEPGFEQFYNSIAFKN